MSNRSYCIEDLLTEWEWEALIETFKRNEIDMENIRDLKDSIYIKELIPSIGLRIKFDKKLREYCIKDNNTSDDTPDEQLFQQVTQLEQFEEQSSSVSLSDPPSNCGSEITEKVEGVINLDDKDENELNLQQFIIVPAQNREISAHSLSELLIKPVLPEFDLKTLLSTDPMGINILNYYKSNKKLENIHRNRLTDIIIKHIFNYIAKHRLRHEEYNILASKIVTLFPNEFPGIYYVPAIKKINSSTGRPILAKGKLVDKCRNLLHSCADVIPRKRKSQDFDEGTNKHLLLEPPNENVKNDIEWLRLRTEPWTEVIPKWLNTFETRRNCHEISVQKFIEEWAILKDVRAHELINLDFDRLYPERTLNLVLNWNRVFKLIFELKRNSVKDQYTLELLSMLEDETILDKFPIEITLLPYLIPPKGRMRLGKTIWKYSTAETVEAIVCHAKVPGDIEKIILEKKNKSLVSKIPVQPYIIVEGTSLSTIRKSYVVIDELRYEFESTRTAFDTCFKLFHVLDAKYPPQAEHIWLIIQQGIYEVYTSSDKTIPSLTEILQNIKQQK